MDETDVSILTKVALELTENGSEHTATLALTDDLQHQMSYQLTPKTLRSLMAPLLQLTKRWEKETDLKIGTLSGPLHPLPASKIVLEKGRNDRECAVRVFVGKTEWTFLLSLEKVIDGMGSLIKRISRERSH